MWKTNPNTNLNMFNNSKSKINVEDILKEYRPNNPSYLSIYLTEIWKDLISRSEENYYNNNNNNNNYYNHPGISRLTFSTYYLLPGIINERLFNVFDKNLDNFLSLDEFINGMSNLFNTKFEELCKFVFQFYDFDQDGYITKEDVKVIFCYFPLNTNRYRLIKFETDDYKERIESQDEMQKILEKTFNNKTKINVDELLEIIYNFSSDIVIYLLIFLYDKKPFTNQSLNEFTISLKDYKIDPIKQFSIPKSLIASPNLQSKFSPSALLSKSIAFKKRNFHNNSNQVKLDKYSKNTSVVNSDFEEVKNNDSIGIANFNSNNKSKLSKKTNETNKSLINISDSNSNYNCSNKLNKSNVNKINLDGKIKQILDNKKENLIKENKDINVNTNTNVNNKTFNTVLKNNNTNNININSNNNKSSYINSSKNKILKISSSSSSLSSLDSIDNNEYNDKKINLKKERELEKKLHNNSDTNKLFTPAIKHTSKIVHINDEQLLSMSLKGNSSSSSWSSSESDSDSDFLQDDKLVAFAGYLYLITDINSLVKIYYKLIYKDFYLFTSKDSNKYNGLNNLSGCLINTENKSVINGIEMFSFSVVHTNKKQMYYCIDEEEYENWVLYLRKVTGYSSLNDIYDIKDQLGHGRFGVVMLGTHKNNGKQVAIKVMKKEIMREEDKQQARREIEILKVCQHPYIIRLLEVFENVEYFYIVMEYCSGNNLFTYLDNRSFQISEKQACNIMHKLLTAIYYLHCYGIAHRDLKPENILMTNNTDDANPKLLDFGLSKIIGPDELCNEPYGTLAYVAPEVLKNIPYNKQVDLWSVGIVNYLLLTGVLPYDITQHNEQEIARQTMDEEVPYFDAVWDLFTKNAKPFVKALLVKDYNKRMTIEEALEHPWIISHEGNLKQEKGNNKFKNYAFLKKK